MLALAIAAAALVLYALSQSRLRNTVLSGPLLFLLLGVLMSPEVFGGFTLELDDETITVLLKVTLVLLLFTEASELRARRLRSEASIPSRLLLVAMPLVMAIGLGFGLVLLGVLSFWEAATLAAILAPTDAALSLPVVQNERVPGVIRRSLVVEAGLNDGLAVPFAFGFAAVVAFKADDLSRPDFLEFLFDQLVFGVVFGLLVGWLGAKLANATLTDDDASNRWGEIAFVALAGVAFASAEAVDGNGFIAAWVAGLAFAFFKLPEIHVQRFADRAGNLLTLASFLVFGALLVPQAFKSMDGATLVYAVAALLIVRPVAVAVSMIGTHFRIPTVAFLGWFGPRGIASLILAALVAKKFDVPNIDTILAVVAVTVALSVLLHGLSAAPGSSSYGDWLRRSGLGPLAGYEKAVATDESGE